ncbi:MAG: DMT family transporter [Ruminococcaceae bacterium]|nr:DMT family transporter [Oscillospiraceae bacterium]
MNRNKAVFAGLAALSAQIIFGFSFMFTKIALKYASPMTVIADRYIVAFIFMSAVLFFKKEKIRFRKNMLKLLVLAGFQPLMYYIFETYGIEMTTSSFSSIMISMIPVVSMICSVFVLKEIPSFFQYVFSALSVCGVVIVALLGAEGGTVTPIGVLFLLGAVISSVGYNIASRKLSKEFSVIERTFVMMLIGVISFVIISFFENINNPIAVISGFASWEFTLAVLYLGAISSVVAFLLLNYANTYLPVAKTVVFANVTTVVSVVAGFIFLDEELSFASVVAIIMIITGIFGVQRLSIKKSGE